VNACGVAVRAGVLALALGTLGATMSACELLTHPSDYAIDAGVPYDGFCNVCPESGADLLHPPCPNGGDGDDGETYVFAQRSVRFGRPGDWTGEDAASFDVGFDLDCSERPEGEPVLCAPVTPDAGTPVPWKPMPHGIDNALVQRIFGPLYETAANAGQDLDLDAEYSKNAEAGKLGLLVVVEGWNGEADDAHVVMSIHSSPGVSEGNGPPRWDGTDRWDRFSDLPGTATSFFTIERAEGYVSGGSLVVDYRSRGDVSFRFGSPARSVRLFLHDVVFAAKLTRDALRPMTMVARADVSGAYEEIPDIARVLGACDPLAETFLLASLPSLLIGAADMPSELGARPESSCDSISFGWTFEAQKARMGGHRAASGEPDAGCP
jgi:hypothetical protein